MGIEYYFVNLKDRTVFEVGKGHELATGTFVALGAGRSAVEAAIKSATADWPDLEDHGAWARDMAGRLLSFLGTAPLDAVVLTNDCDESHDPYIRWPRVGSRYGHEDDRPIKPDP